MPNIIVLPTATKHIISSEISVGIEFLEISEVNEVQVTLASPQSYPAITVSAFRDMDGCQWLLKSLQGADLKVKLDIDSNYRENVPSAQHFTRHLLWNLFIVPTALDFELSNTTDQNFDDLNTKRLELLRNVNDSTQGGGQSFERYPELIGYFTPEYSDAEEAKTGFCPLELLADPNPYRITVHDNVNERDENGVKSGENSARNGKNGENLENGVTESVKEWSMVTFFVEIISNLLLYKTPAPSPIADLERLAMINLKHEFNALSHSYQRLLQDPSIQGFEELEPRKLPKRQDSEMSLPTRRQKIMKIESREFQTGSEVGCQTQKSKKPSFQVLKRSETSLSDSLDCLNRNWVQMVQPKIAVDYRDFNPELLPASVRPLISSTAYVTDCVKELVNWLQGGFENLL